MNRVARPLSESDLRIALRRLLWIGLALLVALAISGFCWLVLRLAGDHGPAEGARGVAMVSLVGLALDVVFLVTILACVELNRNGRGAAPGEEQQEE